jgi:hypothetical protein
MDAYLIVKQIENKKKQIENLDSSNNKGGMNNMGLILSIIIGGYASFLSYECNSKKNVPEVQKILFAILAYIFGLLYLIYYFLFRYDSCNEI